MGQVSLFDKKILSDLKELKPAKISEVVDFIEYLKVRQKSWKERFGTFLKKIEPKMKNISYVDIAKEICKARKNK